MRAFSMNNFCILRFFYCSLFIFSSSYLLCSTALAEAKIHVAYQPASDEQEQAIMEQIRASGVVEEAVSLMTDKFHLEKQIYIVFGQGDGPIFDPETMEIFFPYSAIQEAKDLFHGERSSKKQASANLATLDAFMHTLFHELGHALIEMYSIPIVSREEDAADAFASVLLISFYKDGTEITVHAAELFGLEKEKLSTLRKWDFLGEHSLNVQRYYQIMCHAYGSDPKKYNYLRSQVGFSRERAKMCVEDFEQISKGWLALLKPYMK